MDAKRFIATLIGALVGVIVGNILVMLWAHYFLFKGI